MGRFFSGAETGNALGCPVYCATTRFAAASAEAEIALELVEAPADAEVEAALVGAVDAAALLEDVDDELPHAASAPAAATAIREVRKVM
jgi:hypothetical protein